MPLSQSEIEQLSGQGLVGRLLARELGPHWDDARAPATAINPPGLVSDPDYDDTNLGYLFDATSTERLDVILQFTHGYKEGSHAYPHVHWEATDTGSGNVLWRLEYKWRNNGEADAGFTTVDLLAPASGADSTLQIDGWGALSKAGARISSMFECKLSRIGGDASDTYGADARFKEFDVHIRIDGIGSINETSK